jgi:hypothetical protein
MYTISASLPQGRPESTIECSLETAPFSRSRAHRDATVAARYADDDRFFADAAHIIQLAYNDKQEEETAVALLKNYLKQRRRTA